MADGRQTGQGTDARGSYAPNGGASSRHHAPWDLPSDHPTADALAAPAGRPPDHAPDHDPAAPSGPSAPHGTPWADDPAAHKPGFQAADVLLILFVALFLLLAVPQLELAFDVIVSGATLEGAPFRAVDLWLNGAILLAVFGLLPFLWVLGTRNEAWRGTLMYLRLHDPWRSSALGVGLGIGLVLALIVVGLVMQVLGAAPENPALEELSAVLTLPLALFLSFAAAWGEEVLFRGVLQRWIGVWGQAAVFGLLHAYQGVYGIVFTFALALVFGFMVKRGGSLWIAIVAHFTFDIIQMALIMAYPEGA